MLRDHRFTDSYFEHCSINTYIFVVSRFLISPRTINIYCTVNNTSRGNFVLTTYRKRIRYQCYQLISKEVNLASIQIGTNYFDIINNITQSLYLLKVQSYLHNVILFRPNLGGVEFTRTNFVICQEV